MILEIDGEEYYVPDSWSDSEADAFARRVQRGTISAAEIAKAARQYDTEEGGVAEVLFELKEGAQALSAEILGELQSVKQALPQLPAEPRALPAEPRALEQGSLAEILGELRQIRRVLLADKQLVQDPTTGEMTRSRVVIRRSP